MISSSYLKLKALVLLNVSEDVFTVECNLEVLVIKEVVFFCYGDSNNASTWSNVPYLFTSTLINKGVAVHRIDISPNKYLSLIVNMLLFLYCKLRKLQFTIRFSRTRLFKIITNRKIRKSVDKFPNSDYCIFTCFDYYNKYNSIPSLLFSDWTYEILLRDREKRIPYSFEQKFIDQQTAAISSAQLTVSLFPACTQIMKETYPSGNIHYLGANVINNMYPSVIDANQLIARKKKSKYILFIGGKKYLEGVKLLVSAIEYLNANGVDLKLHIIGMNKKELSNQHPNVYCHGYLHKEIDNELKSYYELLLGAKLVVNPTPLWAGYSSTIEAMYFYTPIIVSPYKDFVQEFGQSINFGRYTSSKTGPDLAKDINLVLKDEDYGKMCMIAHNLVKNYTWNCYVDKLLNLMNDNINIECIGVENKKKY